MKKYLIILFIAALYSCSKTPEKEIIGNWEVYAKETSSGYVEMSTPITCKFTKNGKYYVGKNEIEYSYVLEGNQLFIDGIEHTIYFADDYKEFTITIYDNSVTTYYRK